MTLFFWNSARTVLHPRNTAFLIELNILGLLPFSDVLVKSWVEERYRMKQNFSNFERPNNRLCNGSYVRMEYRSGEMLSPTKAAFSKKDSQLAKEKSFNKSSNNFFRRRTSCTCLVPSRDFSFSLHSLIVLRTAAVCERCRWGRTVKFSKSDVVAKQRWQGLVTDNPCFTAVKFFASGISAQYETTAGKHLQVKDRIERTMKPVLTTSSRALNETLSALCSTDIFCSLPSLVDVTLTSSSNGVTWQSSSTKSVAAFSISVCVISKWDILTGRKPMIV